MHALNLRLVADRLDVTSEAYLPPGKGFLPSVTPAQALPDAFAPYQLACDELPERFGASNGSVRPWLDALFSEHDPAITQAIDRLSPMEQQRAMTMLCTLAHSYRWGNTPPDRAAFELQHLTLPPGVDLPWTHLAALLRQPRVGSLWNMALCNWSLVAKPGASDYSVDEVTIENLHLALGWLNPPLDHVLERFILTFVETEARGVAVIEQSIALVRSTAQDDIREVVRTLEALHEAIMAMNLVFYRNIRAAVIDPVVWNASIKPIHGWGVDAGDGMLEGASGLQLGAIQCADAALGIDDRSCMARAAVDARRYMPVEHQQFLSVMDTVRPLVPAFVRRSGDAVLTQHYTACIDALLAWRRAHRQRGALYLRGTGAGPMGGTTGMTVFSNEHAAVDEFHVLMQERIAETTKARIAVG